MRRLDEFCPDRILTPIAALPVEYVDRVPGSVNDTGMKRHKLVNLTIKTGNLSFFALNGGVSAEFYQPDANHRRFSSSGVTIPLTEQDKNGRALVDFYYSEESPDSNAGPVCVSLYETTTAEVGVRACDLRSASRVFVRPRGDETVSSSSAARLQLDRLGGTFVSSEGMDTSYAFFGKKRAQNGPPTACDEAGLVRIIGSMDMTSLEGIARFAAECNMQDFLCVWTIAKHHEDKARENNRTLFAYELVCLVRRTLFDFYAYFCTIFILVFDGQHRFISSAMMLRGYNNMSCWVPQLSLEPSGRHSVELHPGCHVFSSSVVYLTPMDRSLGIHDVLGELLKYSRNQSSKAANDVKTTCAQHMGQICVRRMEHGGTATMTNFIAKSTWRGGRDSNKRFTHRREKFSVDFFENCAVDVLKKDPLFFKTLLKNARFWGGGCTEDQTGGASCENQVDYIIQVHSRCNHGFNDCYKMNEGTTNKKQNKNMKLDSSYAVLVQTYQILCLTRSGASRLNNVVNMDHTHPKAQYTCSDWSFRIDDYMYPGWLRYRFLPGVDRVVEFLRALFGKVMDYSGATVESSVGRMLTLWLRNIVAEDRMWLLSEEGFNRMLTERAFHGKRCSNRLLDWYLRYLLLPGRLMFRSLAALTSSHHCLLCAGFTGMGIARGSRRTFPA